MHVLLAQQPDRHVCAHVSHWPPAPPSFPTQVSPEGQSPLCVHPHVSFARQVPMPVQFCCSPCVHCTQLEVFVSHTSGGGQSLSTAHVPYTVLTLLLVADSVLLPTVNVLDAWFVYVPLEGRLTVKVTWPEPPLTRLPSDHVMVPLLNVPGADADANVEPVGMVSVIVKLSAGPGPLLL